MFTIDGRLCWNPATGRAEFPFLEFQLGIGRVDWAESGVPTCAGYEPPDRLRLRFGPEVGRPGPARPGVPRSSYGRDRGK